MDGIVCDNCSTPLPAGSKYCSTCGTPVPEGTSHQQAPNGFPVDLREAVQTATQGEYEIHHELGRGGMGRVFLAREISLDRLVALKVLPPSLMFDESLVERFKREARMVAQLHHPNIISIFRVYHSYNLAFYTMQYVPGRTLAQVMRSSPVLPLPEVERLLAEAAEGLAYAHKRGVVHRDIKPGNVLLDSDKHVHITDFGIAKALSQSTQLTDTGAVIGTPQYMAPEQYEGKEVDGRADQYSLAVVGYQLLVGHCPFESESMKQLLYQHLFTPPRPVNTIRPETPMPLRDAIHKALSKSPEDRFESMEDFKAAIEGKGPPIFVTWLEGPASNPKVRKDPISTTHRLRGVPRVGATNLPAVIEDDSQWGVPTVTRIPAYRKAMAGLAAGVVLVVAVAALALSSGNGLGILAQGNGAEAEGSSQASPDQAAMLSLSGSERDGAQPRDTDASDSSDPITLDGLSDENRGSGDATTELAAGAGATMPEPEPKSSEPKPTVSSEIRSEAARPSAPVDRRPSVPAALYDELQHEVEQGNVLNDMGRYHEAVDIYMGIQDRISAAEPSRYSDGVRLRDLWTKAAQAITTARAKCKIELEVGAQTSCP